MIYGAGFVANGVVLILLNLHAWRQRDALQLNQTERMLTQSEIGAWVILCGVGILSVLVGVLFPETPGAPGMTYMLLPILMPIYGIRMKRRRAKMEADAKLAEAGIPSHKDVLQALGARDR